MSSQGIEACRSCGAPVRWVETRSGKHMPIDAEPVPDGNLVRVRASRPTVGYLHANDVPPAGTPRYVSHFATCPDAEKWRQKEAAEAPRSARMRSPKR